MQGAGTSQKQLGQSGNVCGMPFLLSLILQPHAGLSACKDLHLDSNLSMSMPACHSTSLRPYITHLTLEAALCCQDACFCTSQDGSPNSLIIMQCSRHCKVRQVAQQLSFHERACRQGTTLSLTLPHPRLLQGICACRGWWLGPSQNP